MTYVFYIIFIKLFRIFAFLLSQQGFTQRKYKISPRYYSDCYISFKYSYETKGIFYE